MWAGNTRHILGVWDGFEIMKWFTDNWKLTADNVGETIALRRLVLPCEHTVVVRAGRKAQDRTATVRLALSSA
jgi:hypothetical protein